MEESQARDRLASLTGIAKVRLCASLCHAVTSIARDVYGAADPTRKVEWLRATNEIQHRATGILLQLLGGRDFPCDDALVSLFLKKRPDKYLEQHMTAALERVICQYPDGIVTSTGSETNVDSLFEG